ncbi:MAG: DUF1592 domain-containing protein [Singulisphaera sp.]
MPDQVLFELARRGTLHLPEVLEAQVRRMLADPKANALVENFAGQWLQTRNLKTLTPDRKRFPQFDDALRAAMLAESDLFRASSRTIGASSTSSTPTSPSSMSGWRAHGIAGVKGDEFRRVSLTREIARRSPDAGRHPSHHLEPDADLAREAGSGSSSRSSGRPPLPRLPTFRT